MPTKDEHLRKAQHNENLAVTLCGTIYLDWAATTFFYAALHYMDAVLAVQGDDPDTHDRRDSLIRRHPTLRPVFAEYKSLKALSRNARYYATPIEPADIQNVRPQYDALKLTFAAPSAFRAF